MQQKKPKPDALTEFYRDLDRQELTRQGAEHLNHRVDVRVHRFGHLVRVMAWTVFIPERALEKQEEVEEVEVRRRLLVNSLVREGNFRLTHQVSHGGRINLGISPHSNLHFLDFLLFSNAVFRIIAALVLGAGFSGWLLLTAQRSGQTFSEVREQVIRAYDEPGD